jgi:hypothetical protein
MACVATARKVRLTLSGFECNLKMAFACSNTFQGAAQLMLILAKLQKITTSAMTPDDVDEFNSMMSCCF